MPAVLDHGEDEGIARRRWRQTFWTIALSLGVGCGLPAYLFFGSLLGWPMGQDPIATFREKTELLIPASAKIRRFKETSFQDTSLAVVFDLPESDLDGFLAQPVLKGAAALWTSR